MLRTASIRNFLIVFTVIILSACAGQSPSASPVSPAQPTSPSTTATTQAAIPVTSTQTAPTTAPTTVVTPAGPATAAATPASTQSQSVDCTTPATLTPAQTEGPYFKAGSPERSSLAEGLSGTKLTLTGYVLTTDCQPVANAKLDFWQANAQGQYDNSGYTLRGHLFTDASGHYQLETIVPGLYPGRTEHIHVKVQAPNGPELTTQLYFPGVSQNQSDTIYEQSMLIHVQTTDGGVTGTYDFIIATQ